MSTLFKSTKLEVRNPNQALSSKSSNSKQYDLEERTLVFAKAVRVFVKKLPRTIATIEDGKQLIRSSGSVGANYREANESISKKDCLLRIKIARKEAKETQYWLQLIDVGQSQALNQEQQALAQEAFEVMMIFGAILKKLL